MRLSHPHALGALVLLTLALMLPLLSGCGGGGQSSVAEPEQPAPEPAASPYSARFNVDVSSGVVTVTSPSATGTVGTAAVLTGSAVRFTSSTLVDDGGSIGVKALSVEVTNQTSRNLTQARLLFSDINNANTLPDIRSRVTVGTLAGAGSSGFVDGGAGSARFASPAGVTVDDRGDVYVADTSNHAIRRISGGLVSTLAGNGAAGSGDGSGTSAAFSDPAAIVFCPRDDALYVTDYGTHRIRRVTRDGAVNVIAGTGTAGSTEGAGDVAQFNQPYGITTDGTDIYVAERSGHRIRRIRFTGTNPRLASAYTVSTLTGNGTAGSTDGTRSVARLNQPQGLCVGADGAFYVAEYNGCRIRRVETTGIVSTIAGGTSGSVDGTGEVARFSNLAGVVAVPQAGGSTCLVVSDRGNRTLRQVRLMTGASPASASSWVVQTLAGTSGVSGGTNGAGSAALFSGPRHLAADASGNVLMADSGNHGIRRIQPEGGYFPVGTVTGGGGSEPVRLANASGLSPWAGGNPRPYIDCQDLAGGQTSEPLTWSFAVPEGVTGFEFTVTLEALTDPYSPVTAVDGSTSGGVGSGQVLVRTLAGSTAGANGFLDGVGPNARFRCIIGMDLDAEGNLFVADAENNSIRRIEPSGRVSTVAGTIGQGAGYVNGRGNVAKFNYATDIAVAEPGMFANYSAMPTGINVTYIFVTDLDNDRIRLIRTPHSGWTAGDRWEPRDASFYEVATIAGDGTSGYVNGLGSAARFAAPSAITIAPGGIVYVLERTGGNRVRTLQWSGGDPMSAANWQVSLLAGDPGGTSGLVNGSGSSARFNDPRGIATGPDGTVYVADTYNHCIRAITPDGVVSTLAGTDTSGYVDATGSAARFYSPWDIAAGRDGYLYASDRYNRRVRRISPTGVVSTVAGTGASALADGLGSAAGLNDDLGIALGPGGDIYLGEAECVRIIQRIISIGDANAGR